MIGRLRGTLVDKRSPWLIIELSSGLGYELEAPMSTIYRLPEVGKEVTLYTHLVVREDAQLLYGFYDLHERTLFRTLIRVNGVGPKLALTILSSFDPAAFVQCVHHNDSSSLVRVPGIGKKTAERLIVEMRDRLSDELSTDDSASMSIAVPTMTVSPKQEAINALVALGYKPNEATKALSRISNELTCEEMIKQALQGMMQ